jgi:hypothetical protein
MLKELCWDHLASTRNYLELLLAWLAIQDLGTNRRLRFLKMVWVRYFWHSWLLSRWQIVQKPCKNMYMSYLASLWPTALFVCNFLVRFCQWWTTRLAGATALDQMGSYGILRLSKVHVLHFDRRMLGDELLIIVVAAKGTCLNIMTTLVQKADA